MNTRYALQDKMQKRLAQAGIPCKRIHVYGRQIMITSWSFNAASQWADLLKEFSTVSQVWEAIEENEGQKKITGGKKYHKVWRTHATI